MNESAISLQDPMLKDGLVYVDEVRIQLHVWKVAPHFVELGSMLNANPFTRWRVIVSVKQKIKYQDKGYWVLLEFQQSLDPQSDFR